MKKKLKLSQNFDVAIGSLGKYYFDYSEIEKTKSKWPFDENGIRLRPYPPPLFYQYHPMAIAEYALDCHRLYLETKNESYKTNFLNNANWFVENIKIIKNNYGLWLYNFRSTGKYNVKYPYASSMSQGYGISLLLRAYELTSNKAYLKPAYHALNSYEYYVADGGIRNKYKEYTFYEEAPSTPPSCILNGFIFALLGLYDYYRLEKNEKAKTLFDEGIRTLEKCLHLYDLGYWSRYNLQYDKYLASKYYHGAHIIQLIVIHKITNIGIFLKYAELWKSYTNNKKCLMRYYFDYYFYRYKYKLQRIKFFFSSS